MGSIALRWLVIAQCCVLAGVLGAAACGDSGDDDEDHHNDDNGCDEGESHHDDEGDAGDHNAEAPVGKPSGATCPTGSTLTYDNFGKQFMTDYCVRCHSSQLACEDRNGAPAYHDFDSLDDILVVGEHVDQMAAVGPGSTNDDMPPNGKKPTLDERKKLGEWLACELEKLND